MSQRACDSCRVRKVKASPVPTPKGKTRSRPMPGHYFTSCLSCFLVSKCHRVQCDGTGDVPGEPCSNCRMSMLPCQYLRRARKRGRKPLQPSQPPSEYNHRPAPIPTKPSPSLSCSTADASTTSTPQPTWVQPQPDPNARIEASHRQLISSLLACAPRSSPDTIVSNCIDTAVQRIFPIGPIFHEQSLRSSLPLQAPLLSSDTSFHGPSIAGYGVCVADPGGVAKLRSYASLTALCASVSFLPQAEPSTKSVQIGQSFLQASLETLELYQDFDLACPDASSLIIRICHASALHTDGRTTAAWQALNQILGLVEQMQLYDERSFEGLELLEARLRRLAFWQVYILDRYAALIEGKPMRMHHFSLSMPITTQLRADAEPPLLIASLTNESPGLEDQLLAGFYLIQRLWFTASEFALDLQVLSRFCSQASNARIAEEATRLNLAETYIRFIGVLDALSPPLDCLGPINTADDQLTRSSRQRFWLQKTHLLVSYHCLRMIFLQRFADLGLAQTLGCGNDATMLASRKMEVAHDFITVITSVPFDCLLANGESCVAKIRRIGTTLLEVMHEVDNTQIASRAKALFPRLLDVLGRLDSRVSDLLINQSIC